MKKSDSVCSALQAEVQSTKTLLKILEEENRSLLSKGQEDLSDVLQKKETALDECNRLIKSRVASLIDGGFSVDASGLNKWLKSCSSACNEDYSENLALWSQLQSISAKSQELNRINGMIINKLAITIQETLIGIRGGSNSESTYGPNGKKLDGVQSRSLVVG